MRYLLCLFGFHYEQGRGRVTHVKPKRGPFDESTDEARSYKRDKWQCVHCGQHGETDVEEVCLYI